jgi:hypothetical protein
MRICTCLPLISASSFIESEATTGRNSTFFEALASNKELGATRGIDAALKTYNLDALVLPAPGLVAAFPAGMAWQSSRLYKKSVSNL